MALVNSLKPGLPSYAIRLTLRLSPCHMLPDNLCLHPTTSTRIAEAITHDEARINGLTKLRHFSSAERPGEMLRTEYSLWLMRSSILSASRCICRFWYKTLYKGIH